MKLHSVIASSLLNMANELPAFNIPLFEAGAPDSGFHITNNPAQPYQRSEVIQRDGAVDVSCELVDVVHGAMAADSDYWATLIVLLFRFDPQHKSRRILRATIELDFGTNDPHGEPPVVDAISFDGNFSLNPSSQQESTTVGLEGSVGISYGANLSVGPKWEKTVSRETSDAATVSGSRRVIGNIPPYRRARWVLLENKALKSGIPASLQVAVRIKRTDEAVFSLFPSLKCKLDRWSTLEECFSRIPQDDPVLLKPDTKATNRLRTFDKEELGNVNLEELGETRFSIQKQ